MNSREMLTTYAAGNGVAMEIAAAETATAIFSDAVADLGNPDDGEGPSDLPSADGLVRFHV